MGNFFGYQEFITNHLKKLDRNIMIVLKHLTENLQYMFLKVLLGVSRKTSSWAVTTEFGRFPLAVKAYVQISASF